MSVLRDIDLEVLYEGTFSRKPKSLPPGISVEDILDLDEYTKEMCGADEEIKEAEDQTNPSIGANITGVPDTDMEEIIQKRSEKEQLRATIPYIHRSNIIDEHGNPLEPEKLKEQIMVRPKRILKQNSKLQKSSTGEYMFFNINLPAFSGLYVDENSPDKEFKILKTCPSAGKCLNFCYARKGGYIQYPASNVSSSRLLNFLMNDWEGFKTLLISEIKAETIKNNKKNIKTVIRWHDSGDFFSEGYLQLAFHVARETPFCIHYAYTKEFDKFEREDKPKNFVFNISVGGKSDKLIDIKKHKSSEVVTKDLFADLQPKEKGQKWNFSPEAIETLKERTAKEFDIPKDFIVTYDEMQNIPYDPEKDTEKKWFVLVWPGHGDQSAFRNDVQSTLLLVH